MSDHNERACPYCGSLLCRETCETAQRHSTIRDTLIGLLLRDSSASLFNDRIAIYEDAGNIVDVLLPTVWRLVASPPQPVDQRALKSQVTHSLFQLLRKAKPGLSAQDIIENIWPFIEPSLQGKGPDDEFRAQLSALIGCSSPSGEAELQQIESWRDELTRLRAPALTLHLWSTITGLASVLPLEQCEWRCTFCGVKRTDENSSQPCPVKIDDELKSVRGTLSQRERELSRLRQVFENLGAWAQESIDDFDRMIKESGSGASAVTLLAAKSVHQSVLLRLPLEHVLSADPPRAHEMSDKFKTVHHRGTFSGTVCDVCGRPATAIGAGTSVGSFARCDDHFPGADSDVLSDVRKSMETLKTDRGYGPNVVLAGAGQLGACDSCGRPATMRIGNAIRCDEHDPRAAEGGGER